MGLNLLNSLTGFVTFCIFAVILQCFAYNSNESLNESDNKKISIWAPFKEKDEGEEHVGVFSYSDFVNKNYNTTSNNNSNSHEDFWIAMIMLVISSILFILIGDTFSYFAL